MEKLNYHIYQSLSLFAQVTVSGPRGSSKFLQGDSHVEFAVAPLWKYVISSFFKTIGLARDKKFDVVFCGSGAAILAGYAAARLSKSKLVCYLHGLDVIAESFIYKAIFLPLIKKSDLLIVNSNHTKQLAISAGINPEKLNILHPGTDLFDVSTKQKMREKFRDQYDLGDGPIILIAGRITTRKGIPEFIENVMLSLKGEHPKLKLIIVGREAEQAIQHTIGVTERIQRLISHLDLVDHVKLLGSLDDEGLSSAYFATDVMVFPVLKMKGDVEGFGMVAIEAAAHGLPTVGFAVGGVPDAIGESESGWLIEEGNYLEMENRLAKLLDGNAEGVTDSSCIAFSEQFGWSMFGKRLGLILESSNDK
jgi:phosphatidylinositol alpha-1,6-mannosyltransferase